MPSSCAAFGCGNTGGRDDVVFHVFPKDKKLAAQWVRAVRRDNFVPTKSTALCSDHFRDSDYYRSLTTMRAIGMPVKSSRLKPGVVPSIFSHKRNTSPPPRAAFANRGKREVLAELLENLAPDEPVPLPSPIEEFEAAIVPQAAGVEQNCPETADKSLQVLIQPVTSCTATQADMKKKCSFISCGTQTKLRGV
nr:THAP domain-containing protein 1-like [Dermacentor andersoni]